MASVMVDGKMTFRKMRLAYRREYFNSCYRPLKGKQAALSWAAQWALSARRLRVDVWHELNGSKDDVDQIGFDRSKLKTSFRKFRKKIQGDLCCYCGKPLEDGSPIEHVLPRSKYPQFSFNLFNLALSCKVCNSKKDDDVWGACHFESCVYPDCDSVSEYFHPVYDSLPSNVWFERRQTAQGAIAVFVGKTAKGRALCTALLSKVSRQEVRGAALPMLQAAVDVLDQKLQGDWMQDKAACQAFVGKLTEILDDLKC